MADVYSNEDARNLLKGKHILYLGDSNIRAQYKDLVWLLHYNTLITKAALRGKLERSYLGDVLLSSQTFLHRGRSYREARKYKDKVNETTVEFMFIARCYTTDLEELFYSYKRKQEIVPDVIVINSCLWDLTRWGPNGVPEYKDNMVKLMRLMSQSLPKSCLVIWTTALPAASHVGGGLIIKQIEFMQPLLRFEVMEANTFARELVVSHGFDVLDNHYHMRMQIHRLFKDGIHYTCCPVRLMTNLLLTHCALSWGVPLPGNVTSISLAKAIELDNKPNKQVTPVKLPTSSIFTRLSPIQPKPKKTSSSGLLVTVDASGSSRRCDLFKEDLQAQSSNKGIPKHKPKPLSLSSVNTSPILHGFGGSGRYVSLQRYWDMPPLPEIPTENDDSYIAEAETSFGPYRRKRRMSGNKRRTPYWNGRY